MTSDISITKKFLHISPSKIQKYADKIKGKSYKEALLFLEKFPQKASHEIYETLKLVGEKAKNIHLVDINTLIVQQIFANRGSILKRIHARARGKAYRIEKKFSHLTISLKNR